MASRVLTAGCNLKSQLDKKKFSLDCYLEMVFQTEKREKQKDEKHK